MIKKYEVSIYGRTNTIITSIRDEKLYNEIVLAKSKNDAKNEAINNFYVFMNDMWKSIINRRDVRVECELMSWDVNNEDMVYINKIMLDKQHEV